MLADDPAGETARRAREHLKATKNGDRAARGDARARPAATAQLVMVMKPLPAAILHLGARLSRSSATFAARRRCILCSMAAPR